MKWKKDFGLVYHVWQGHVLERRSSDDVSKLRSGWVAILTSYGGTFQHGVVVLNTLFYYIE